MPKRKYDIDMDTVFRMRIKSADKLSLFSASADIADNASDFWRDYSLFTAEQIERLKAGDITSDEFGELLAEYVDSLMTAAEQDEP